MINQKFYLVPILILFIILSAFLVYKVGDIRPALMPAKETSTTTTSSTKSTNNTLPINVTNRTYVKVFGSINGARDLEFTPNGTLLASSPADGAVYAVADKNNQNGSSTSKVVVKNLSRPHGLAFYNGKLFIAEDNRLARYNFDETSLTATLDKVLMSQPTGNHSAHTLLFDKAGNLYVKIGSSCNVCYEADNKRGTILKTNANGDNPVIFAKGLRNAPFMVRNEQTNQIWVTEMGRDFLGDNLPPDEINIVSEGKDYGWPVCFGKKVHDANFDRKQYSRNPCLDTEAPIFEIPAHSAPLGLTFINSSKLPRDWQGDLLVAYHGSWNRSVPDGYKVVHMKVEGEKITSSEDFMTGFIDGSSAIGRPVDVIFDSQGRLFVSDDKAGKIYLVDFAN